MDNIHFYKFLRSEHHPFKNAQASVRLGSFKYYQNIENEQIADKEEGMLKYKVNGVTFDKNNVSNIPFLPKMFNMDEGGSVSFHGVTLQSEFPNCLIFCLSYFSLQPTIEKLNNLSKRLNYDSHYQILDINKFSAICANKITEKLNIRKIGVDLSYLSIFELSQIKVGFKHGIVNYLDSDIEVKNEQDNHSSFDRLMEHLFSKRSHFQNDKEYRIVFFILLGDKVLPFKDEWLDIPVNIYDGVLL